MDWIQGNIGGWTTWLGVSLSSRHTKRWACVLVRRNATILYGQNQNLTETCNSNINIIWAIFKTDESRPPLPLKKVEGMLGLSEVCDSTTNQQGIRKHVMPPTSLGSPMSRTQI